MTSRPILFSAPMVRALLNGSKTQTRRMIKPQPEPIGGEARHAHWSWRGGMFALRMYPSQSTLINRCPYGQPGDELWVRETLDHDAARGHFYKATGMYVGPLLDYEREPPPAIGLPARAIPSIHMPRWASRITLRITDVRVERLQDISEADALAEGSREWAAEQDTPVRDIPAGETRLIYRQLWESINGKGAWDANPWVWALTFERVK